MILPISKAKLIALFAPAVLGAFAGAGFQYFFQLAKPDVTLLDVTVPTLERPDNPKRKIQISDKMLALAKESHVSPRFTKRDDGAGLGRLRQRRETRTQFSYE